MSIIYTRLGEVALRHEFYRDGVAKGLQVWPSVETSKLMKNGRIIFRQTAGGIVLLFRAEEDETTPLSPLSLPQSFFFFFSPENPSAFLQISDLNNGSETYQSGKLPNFKNSPALASTDPNNPEELSYQLLDGIRSKTFSIDVKLSPVPSSVLIKVRDATGNVISPGKDIHETPLPDAFELTPDEQGIFRFIFSLQGKKEGVYSFSLRNAGDTEDLWIKSFWLGNESPNQGFGLIELRYANTPNHLYGSREYYNLTIPMKESLWTYYVVNGNKKVDLISSSLDIEDDGNEGSVPYGTYLFDQIGASPNSDIKVNNLDTVVFRSQSKIPFFETPKLNLKLVKSPGNQVLISNLPNPSRSSPTKDFGGEANSEIYVFI